MTTPPLDTARARLISGFGPRRGEYHAGIDLAAQRGEPVRAVRAGRVVVSAPSGQLRGYGNVVVIEHSTGEATLYAHLDARAVNRGDYATERQTIGTVGTTAGTRDDPSKQTSGPHLYFELLARWPPPGPKRGRLDPTGLWPPAVAGRQPAHPRPAPRPQSDPSRQTRQGSGGALIVLVAYALARRL